MPEQAVRLEAPSRDLKKGAQIVGVTDQIYDVSGNDVHIDEILVTGDLSGRLSYNGRTIEIININEVIGMLVDERGARGPVWKDVEARIVA